EHRIDQALLDPLLVGVADRSNAKELEDRAVGAGPMAILVEVEAAAVLPPLPVVGAHHAHGARWPQPVPDPLMHHPPPLLPRLRPRTESPPPGLPRRSPPGCSSRSGSLLRAAAPPR